MKNSLKNSALAVLSVMFLLLTTRCDDEGPIDPPVEEPPTFTGVDPNPAKLTTRFIYIVPSDRTLNETYTEAIKTCAGSLADWYKDQLGNTKTFHLGSMVVETIQSTHPAAWFDANNGAESGQDSTFYFFSNAKSDLKSLLGASYDENKYTYVVYVDAQGFTGAGHLKLCIMPENDLLGLTGQMEEPVSRWIGGAGHELGHAFGLPHPDDPDPDAIMSTGFRRYPDCYLLDADKETLSASSFIY